MTSMSHVSARHVGAGRYDAPVPPDAPVSRWDKKKQATREALVAAASELFREKGFAETTVQEITDAADVSERTFFRYFESKEDLLLPDLIELFRAAESELARRPPGEPPLEALHEAVRAPILGRVGRGLVRASRDLSPASAPSLGRIVRMFVEWEERLTTLLVQRFAANGADAASEDVRLCAAVAARVGVGALRSGLRAFRAAPARGRRSASALAGHVSDAFEIARAGCPAPPVRRPRAPGARGARGTRAR